MQKNGENPYIHLLSDTTSINSVQCFYALETLEDTTPSWFRVMTQKGSWVFSVEWDDDHQFTIDLESED